MFLLRFIWPLRGLALLLAVALTVSGFAHHFASPDDEAAALYARSFGLSLSDICGGEDATLGKPCDACRLHAAMALGDPAMRIVTADVSLAPVQWDRSGAPLHAARTATKQPARAPPTV